MNYAVKITKSGSYISYCDKCWYETAGKEPLYLYSHDRALEIAEQMKSHYTYNLTIVGEDGSTEIINHLCKKNPMVEPETQTTVKKCLTKIRVKR